MSNVTEVTKSITVRGLTIPNRIALAPMCTWMADPTRNEANERHLVHYGGIAMGGAGLVIVEATPVEYRGRIEPGDVGLWDDRQIAGLQRINNFIHENTIAKTAIQLGHAGRKGTLLNCMTPVPTHLKVTDQYGSQCVGPSAKSFQDGVYLVPQELTIEEMQIIKRSFVSAAMRAVKAGFDAIEIHSAHGYLLSSFTSPLANTRTDQYGGSLENRLRYPLEVISSVRAAIPDMMPLIVRFSAEEWVEGGFNIDDAKVYAQKLESVGVDILHISSGGISFAQKFPRVPQFQIPLAAQVKSVVTKALVMAVGEITDIQDAASILHEKQADFVGVGRAFLKDPYWFRNEMEKLGAKAWSPSYQIPAYISLRKIHKEIQESESQTEAKRTEISA